MYMYINVEVKLVGFTEAATEKRIPEYVKLICSEVLE